MRREREVGAEVIEFVMGLEAFGLGAKARAIRLRALTRDIRPLLWRQRELLAPAYAGLECDDVAVKALDGELVGAWERCLEQLRVLWLTEGPAAEDEGSP